MTKAQDNLKTKLLDRFSKGDAEISVTMDSNKVLLDAMQEHAIEFAEWLIKEEWNTASKERGGWYRFNAAPAPTRHTFKTTEELYTLFNNQPTKQ